MWVAVEGVLLLSHRGFPHIPGYAPRLLPFHRSHHVVREQAELPRRLVAIRPMFSSRLLGQEPKLAPVSSFSCSRILCAVTSSLFGFVPD